MRRRDRVSKLLEWDFPYHRDKMMKTVQSLECYYLLFHLIRHAVFGLVLGQVNLRASPSNTLLMIWTIERDDKPLLSKRKTLLRRGSLKHKNLVAGKYSPIWGSPPKAKHSAVAHPRRIEVSHYEFIPCFHKSLEIQASIDQSCRVVMPCSILPCYYR